MYEPTRYRRRIPGLSVLTACLSWFTLSPAMGQPPDEATVRAEIASIAALEHSTPEQTKKARNERLDALFRTYLATHGSDPPGTIRDFTAMVQEAGLTTFSDFLQAETTPCRTVPDPVTGDSVPVYGALGSDLINPWLAAIEIEPGRPLVDQPAYQCAVNALREHIDFVLVGIADPSLTSDMIPPKLRENVQSAYSQLNPTNEFRGAFDHPLFYAAVRLGAKKLFREDYPQAKLTMAQLVQPENRGGFGVRSCLLCHDRDYNGVYRRVLSQSLYYNAEARQSPEDSTARKEALEKATIYRVAAQHILEAYDDQIDQQAVRQSLSLVDNVERLKPGYNRFRDSLANFGCLKCHSQDGDPPPDMDPREFGAYVLQPSDYYKSQNIKALLKYINFDDIDQSELVLKASARVDHEGQPVVELDAAQLVRLRAELVTWIKSVEAASE